MRSTARRQFLPEVQLAYAGYVGWRGLAEESAFSESTRAALFGRFAFCLPDGDDDDTLFRLITLGTGSLSPGDAFQKQGFVRKGSENVVGPMPPFGEIIKTEDDIWKIIAWIRLINCERDAARC